MKYIIDIEDEYTKDWVNDTPMCKELCMPISVPNRQRTYHVSTGFKLEPYTEPDRKAIEDEVWEFARKIISTSENEMSEMWGCATNFGEVMHNTTYSEAKAKYEKWRKQRDEIHVGDEVIYNSRTRAVVLKPENEERYGTIFTSEFSTIAVSHNELEKTGRHFDEVEELLEKMKEGDRS